MLHAMVDAFERGLRWHAGNNPIKELQREKMLKCSFDFTHCFV